MWQEHGAKRYRTEANRKGGRWFRSKAPTRTAHPAQIGYWLSYRWSECRNLRDQATLERAGCEDGASGREGDGCSQSSALEDILDACRAQVARLRATAGGEVNRKLLGRGRERRVCMLLGVALPHNNAIDSDALPAHLCALARARHRERYVSPNVRRSPSHPL